MFYRQTHRRTSHTHGLCRRAAEGNGRMTPLGHSGDLARELRLFVMSRLLSLLSLRGHMLFVQLVQAGSWPGEGISTDSGSRRTGILPSRPRLTLRSLRVGPSSQVSLGVSVECDKRPPYKGRRPLLEDRVQAQSSCDTAGEERRAPARSSGAGGTLPAPLGPDPSDHAGS